MGGEGLEIAVAADFHIGSPFSSLPADMAVRAKALQEQCLREFCQMAGRKNLPYLLIAGDLFDRLDLPLALLRRTQQSFSLCPRTKVLISPGNHDPYFPKGLWDDPHWPKNVHVVRTESEVFDFPEHGLRIYSAAFLTQSARLPVLEKLKIPVDREKLNLLLLHGEIVAAGQHSNYNPLPREWLRDSGLDLALVGHIHQTSGLVRESEGFYTLIPGCPMGRGFDECGEKGTYLLRLRKNLQFKQSVLKVEASFIPFTAARFQRLHLDISSFDCESQEELAFILRQSILEKARISGEERHSCLLEVELCGISRLRPDVDFLERQLRDEFMLLRLEDKSFPAFSLMKTSEDSRFSSFLSREYQRLESSGEVDREILQRCQRLLLSSLQGELHGSLN